MSATMLKKPVNLRTKMAQKQKFSLKKSNNSEKDCLNWATVSSMMVSELFIEHTAVLSELIINIGLLAF